MNLWFTFLICLVYVTSVLGSNCGPEFKGKCICGEIVFQDKLQYVVNCTDTHFTNVSVLQHLPDQIQVLIFTGNNIPQLPWNVFGTFKDYEKLHVVDMSNNKIQEILGKSYHRVSNVERLILNHNNISISSGEGFNHHHPRMFSNFENLKELHLTNAFVDHSNNLGEDLHDIFVNSNLTQLIKLHLEQNEISLFKDKKVFCDLPKLMDLHLGDNLLAGIDFEIKCLGHLRYIDLESNEIRVLTSKEFAILDQLPARNQSLTVDLGSNPFSCDCVIDELFTWLNSTKVNVQRKDLIRCYHTHPLDENPINTKKADCVNKKTMVMTVASAQHEATEIVLGLLLVVMIILFAAIIYNNGRAIRHRLNPILDSVSRKVHYTSIGHQEDLEVEV